GVRTRGGIEGAQGAVRGPAHHAVRERVAIDVGRRDAAADRRVFRRGDAGAGGDRRVVDGRDGDAHSGDVRIHAAVVRLEGEAVGAVVVRVRRVRVRAGGGIERAQRAVRRSARDGIR